LLRICFVFGATCDVLCSRLFKALLRQIKVDGTTSEVWWASLQRNGVSGFCDFVFASFSWSPFVFGSCSARRQT
jgi:hypothetical protein